MTSSLELRVDPFSHRLLVNVFETGVDVDVVGVVSHVNVINNTKHGSNFQTKHFKTQKIK